MQKKLPNHETQDSVRLQCHIRILVRTTLVPQIFLYNYRNFTKFDSGRVVKATKVMLDSLDKKEKEQTEFHSSVQLYSVEKIKYPFGDIGPLTAENPLEKEGSFQALLGYR
ncbi:hypothetical protein J6590_065807 [Homalodisca vitripennis]|nr:hypothetical protein J6590_065807 [Homalodisca vitripennis]